MPFLLKIQPIDFNTPEESACYVPVKPVAKSRFKRLFERPLASVSRISAVDKGATAAGGVVEELNGNRDVPDEFEPSSVCLASMVQNFIEESNDKQSSAPVRCSRNMCNCFNGNCNDCSDDEFDSSTDACEILKSLVMCSTDSERNLLTDTAKIVEKNKDAFCGRIVVVDGLLALRYEASICKSRWGKTPSYPAGEYDYVDVIIEGERFIIDIDFRSEFEIARSTKTYNSILQTLPCIFVGKADRLEKIIHVISEAAKQSLKKKGMPFPPWRAAEYVKAKWLSPYTRSASPPTPTILDSTNLKSDNKEPSIGNKKTPPCDELHRNNSPAETEHGDPVFMHTVKDGVRNFFCSGLRSPNHIQLPLAPTPSKATLAPAHAKVAPVPSPTKAPPAPAPTAVVESPNEYRHGVQIPLQTTVSPVLGITEKATNLVKSHGFS